VAARHLTWLTGRTMEVGGFPDSGNTSGVVASPDFGLSIFFFKDYLIFKINNQVLLGLFCKLKSDESGLGGNFLLVAKTPSFLPQSNSSTSLYCFRLSGGATLSLGQSLKSIL
jgi:hypothetical protein